MANDTITHFMWGYQRHFRGRAERQAKTALQSLDSRIVPELFLIGIPADPSEQHWPVCVEPETDFWITADDFAGVKKRADNLYAADPEAQLMHSHPLAHESHHDRVRRRAMQRAAREKLEGHPSKPADLTHFVSMPVRVGMYWVCVVLSVQAAVLGNHPRLNSDAIVHGQRSYVLSRSLLDAVINVLLEGFCEQLRLPDPGSVPSDFESEELIRAAAKRFVAECAVRIHNEGLADHSTLFRACDTISSLSYEKAVGRGVVVFARNNHPAIKTAVRFSMPTDLREFRASRKFLELTAHGLSIHSDTQRIYGLASIDNYDAAKEDLFELRVLGRQEWEFAHAGRSLMRVEFGRPMLPKPPFDAERLAIDLRRIFREVTSAQIDQFAEIVRCAEKETHGTTIVISQEARREAGRLQSQSTCILPCKMDHSLLKHVTAIDGAVLLSPDATCHAIGVILDGMASEHGNPGRGARFNSALRYIETSKHKTLVIVVSSDGGIDFVPKLMPPISRVEIEARIAAFVALSEQAAPSRRRFYDQLDWFLPREFYLQAAHCEKINRVAEEIEKKIWAAEPDAFRIHRRPFEPEPSFNPDMFYFENIPEPKWA